MNDFLRSALYISIVLLLPIAYLFYTRSTKITNKNVCIIGGTSGLGLSLAKYLYSLGNDITITSRRSENLEKIINAHFRTESKQNKVSGRIFDSLTDIIPVDENFDIVFYCPGVAVPGYFKNQNDEVFDSQIKLNYLGMIRSLYHFKKCNRFPFKFVMVSSTTALFTFPGYSSYAPTKTCLKSFFESARYELLAENIELKILYACAMNTPGLKKENESKPEFTKDIEFTNFIAEPDRMAEYCVKNLEKRNSHSYDWLTYFLMIRNECENAIDYVLFPVAVVVVFFTKIYVKKTFNKYKVK